MEKGAHIELSDRFDILADELLICILSFLSLKEATATSILSRRWRYLWTFTCKLNFDGFDFFRKLWPKSKIPEDFDTIYKAWATWENYEESLNYARWVDNVLRVHKCSSIEEFRLDFFLVEFHKMYIHRWLRFASARKVQSLELNLRVGDHAPSYTFEYELLIEFKHLKKLRMQWVNVSDEGFEFILCTCPLLEELSITLSEQLTAVKIIGPSPALKRLEINYCVNLTSVEIRDTGLVTFMYQGKMLQQFILKNVPRLVEMHLGGAIFRSMKDFLSMLQCYLPQLEKLTIDTLWKDFFGREGAMMLYKNVKMSNLKQLVVKFFEVGFDKYELVSLAYFIRASPLLQSLVLEAYGGGEEEVIEVVEEEEEEEEGGGGGRYFRNTEVTLPEKGELEAMGSYEYPHLKRVQIVGFRCTWSQLDIVMHLLENGSALEEFIIDLRKRDNAWFYYNLFMPNSVTYSLPVGYPIIRVGHPCVQEDQINALKANLKDQLTKRLASTFHPHLNIRIL